MGVLLIYMHSRMTVLNAVILLQIVMMSPGAHLLKNCASQSITNESQLRKKEKRKNKEPCLGLYVTRQLIWRQTPKLFITIY